MRRKRGCLLRLRRREQERLQGDAATRRAALLAAAEQLRQTHQGTVTASWQGATGNSHLTYKASVRVYIRLWRILHHTGACPVGWHCIACVFLLLC